MTFLHDVVKRLFGLEASQGVELFPGPALARDDVRRRIKRSLRVRKPVIVYLQDKLGGEISLSATERSPELAFDTTLVEVTPSSGDSMSLVQYGILEVQTMDFHGSYRSAVKNLKDALRLHKDDFQEVLQKKREWLSERIEGPNIANVFKRTFYQMMLKFRIGAHPPCVGCVLAIPASVWDSWQRHLGKPELSRRADGSALLAESSATTYRAPAWIYVFDTVPESEVSPNRINVVDVIATDADSIAHYALRVAPEAAVAVGGSADRILTQIHKRLATWWPELVSRDR